jgi:hypothetical protein
MRRENHETHSLMYHNKGDGTFDKITAGAIVNDKS